MTVQIIPTSIDLVNYVQTTALDGRDYIFRFLYNQREDRWYLNLSDENGDPIVDGIKVVVATSLLKRVTDSRRPPGILMARDLTAVEPDLAGGEQIAEEDPGQNDLGGRVLLFYTPLEDLGGDPASLA